MKLALSGFGRATTTGHLFLYADYNGESRAMQVKNASLPTLAYVVADLILSQATSDKEERIQIPFPWATDEIIDFIMTGTLPDDEHPMYQATVGTDEEPDPGPDDIWEEAHEAILEAEFAADPNLPRLMID